MVAPFEYFENMDVRRRRRTRRNSNISFLKTVIFISILLIHVRISKGFLFVIRPTLTGMKEKYTMARRAKAVCEMKLKVKEENPGNNQNSNIFVDRSCLGCGTCRIVCPSGVFGANGLRTVVHRDPLDEEEKIKAVRAMVSCPAGAIRLRRPDPFVKEVVTKDIPYLVDEEELPGIYYLSYHSKESLGTTPYLIVRGKKGNIMIDAPRFNGRLAQQIDALGGVAYNVITHEGAAPHQDMWHAYYPQSERIVHRMDLTRTTRDVENVLNGKGPWTIDDDVKILFLPGYSLGSIGVLVQPARAADQLEETLIDRQHHHTPTDDLQTVRRDDAQSLKEGVLFSGRTIGWSPRLGRLDGFLQFSDGHLGRHAESIRSLTKEEFSWLLPSEGMKYRFFSAGHKADLLDEAADRLLEHGRVGAGFNL